MPAPLTPAALTTAARHARAARTLRERLDRALAARDEAIRAAVAEGHPVADVARATRMTRGRASQVVHAEERSSGDGGAHAAASAATRSDNA